MEGGSVGDPGGPSDPGGPTSTPLNPAALLVVAALTSGASRVRSAQAALMCSSAVAARATRPVSGAASLSPAASLAVKATRARRGAALLTPTSALTSSGSGRTNLFVSSTLMVNGSILKRGSAILTPGSTVLALPHKAVSATSALSVAANAPAGSGSRLRTAQAALHSSVTAGSTEKRPASLTVSAIVFAAGTVKSAGGTSLATTTTLIAKAGVIYHGSSSLRPEVRVTAKPFGITTVKPVPFSIMQRRRR